MKEMLKLNDLSYEIMDVSLFEGVNSSVLQGEVIGIIGKNGAGKSTLLQLITGERQPSSGQIQWVGQEADILMVEQETESYASGHQSPLEIKLLEKWQVPAVGYVRMSGGEKLKARLAKGFAADAGLLLLDEPTNHLDEQSMEILKEQIAAYKGTIILVSHDRHFLDDAVSKIWSIEDKQLIEHKGNYSSYMEARRQKRLAQQREYEKQQKMVERIEGQLNELSSWANTGHAKSMKEEGFKEYHRVKAKRLDSQVKSKRKRLEKELEKSKAAPVAPEHEVRFSISANTKRGKRFLEVKNLAKSFDGRKLFEGAHFTIQHGERVAITGPNGSGKTTFLKIVMGMETAEGEVWVSPAASVGYLTQEVFDLPLDQTPEDLFYRETFAERGKVQTLMKHLGFTASQWKEPIGNMSMGERVKCKLMEYILEEKDVLILDEPTNHLDLPSREQLEETLSAYPGTLLAVSHDRYFLEKITSSKLVIAGGTIQRQFDQEPETRDDREELRMKLETERQEVLGKLSFMTPKDKEYQELDRKFNELTRQIRELG